MAGCQISYSNLTSSSSGTIIIDCPSVLRFFQGTSVRLPEVTRGRVQLRRYTPHPHVTTRSSFQLFNFYLVSGGEFAENTKIIRSLLTLDTSVPTFVCGDMNFIENASDSTSRDPTLPTREFQEVWEAFKTRFGVVDVEHDAHTFFHINSEDPTSKHSWSSRLDRFLVPVDVSTHPLFDPVVDIPHHPTNHSVRTSRAAFSDHLPVRLSFQDSSARSSGRPSIPTWLAESPTFEKGSP